MPNRTDPPLGRLRRRIVSLLTMLSFLVMAVTGVLAFLRPFSISVTGLHSLMGFLFIGLIALHVLNNRRPLRSYLRSRSFFLTIGVTVSLSALFWWQPAPVRMVLGLSGNLGPAMERFEMRADEMVFDYSPSPNYKMRLNVKTGPAYKSEIPPNVAIWLENQGGYHIKTLLEPTDAKELPYWSFKHAGWEKAKREAAEHGEIDAVSSPTPNGSFNPADYILPSASTDLTPYSLLLEINQPGDNQASLVHSVIIDNTLPRAYQLLELRGYPKREIGKELKKETWGLYYVDETFDTAIDLIDSALLTIKRTK